jgi:hypothetical protein
MQSPSCEATTDDIATNVEFVVNIFNFWLGTVFMSFNEYFALYYLLRPCFEFPFFKNFVLYYENFAL